LAPVLDLDSGTRRDWLERVVFRGIVFNMSWEDPEMDRRAFRVQPTDTVLSITSAGCNSLNLLCQSPRKLLCIDSNPSQTALLELKLAGIATLDHGTFFDIFAARRPAQVTAVYRRLLRPRLSERAKWFWDRNLWIAAQGLYRFGRMGLFCRVLRRFIQLLGIDRSKAADFFQLESLEEQAAWYDRYVARRLWRPWSRAFVQFKPILYLAGVHPEQFNLVDDRHDMYSYVKERIEYALTRVPVRDNYFLRMAIMGSFDEQHVPPYLMPEHFATLRRNLDRVRIVNGWLGPYLDSLPAESIHKFNLLDIFDWMTAEQFEQTLISVVRVAAPDAVAIYRSGSYRLDPPASILPHVELHRELAQELLATDRSATYGSFYVMSINHRGNGKPTAAPTAPALRDKPLPALAPA